MCCFAFFLYISCLLTLQQLQTFSFCFECEVNSLCSILGNPFLSSNQPGSEKTHPALCSDACGPTPPPFFQIRHASLESPAFKFAMEIPGKIGQIVLGSVYFCLIDKNIGFVIFALAFQAQTMKTRHIKVRQSVEHMYLSHV